MNIDFNKRAEEIINNFKKYYLNDDGLISIHYPPSNRTIYDNFDDIAPFFLYFKEVDFLLEQILIIKKKNYSFDKILAKGNLIYSYKIDEYLGGLFCLWKETKNKDVYGMIVDGIKKVKEYFISNNNIYGFYNIKNKKQSTFYYYWSAGLLETFLEMKDEFPELLDLVKKITDNWLNNPFFLEHHLFPFRWSEHSLKNYTNKLINHLNRYCRHFPPEKGKGNNLISNLKARANNIIYSYLYSGLFVQLMKANTTFIFTLIDLYKLTKTRKYYRAILNWVDAVIDKMMKDNIVYGSYYLNGKIKDKTLTNSFIFIDVLMDTYFYVEKNPKFLKITKKIIDTQLSFRWENGLMPITSNAKITHLDNLVDFSVSIRRYANLSGENSYLEYAKEIMEKTLKYHKGEYGYYNNIDINERPVNYQINRYPPKYNGLLLKGIINILTIDKNMYEDTNLHDIFNDR